MESRVEPSAMRAEVPGSQYNIQAFSNLDSSYLDARPFSQIGVNTPKEPYEHTNGAVSAGGPLRIPHLWHTNNGQFFLQYNWGRIHSDAVSPPALVPTQAEREGNLSQLTSLGQPVTVYRSRPTAIRFPATSFRKIAFRLKLRHCWAYYPLAQFQPHAAYNYQVPIVSINNTDGMQTRLNKMINTKNFLFANFNYQNTRTVTPNLFGFTDTSHTTGMNGTASWRRMISQRLNINSTIQFSRQTVDVTPYFENRENVSGDAGITGNYQNPQYWGPRHSEFQQRSTR
jgi:hypothetical protein